MKKLVLLSLVLSIGLGGFSQENPQNLKSLRNISKTATYVSPTDEVVVMGVTQNPYVSNSRDLIGEDEIGNTWYDLQSNSMLSNRMHVFSDGTIGAVWTRGVDDAPNFPDRGTGYNYFNGEVWDNQPTSSVEQVRAGWPSYAPLGENGEIIISHDYPNNLVVCTREQKGTGEWNFSELYGPTGHPGIAWPRIATSGENHNTIHVLVNSYDEYAGMDAAVLYYRSLDAGATWDVEGEIIDGMGSDYYKDISADAYVWAEENGGAIAFLVAGAWHDMFMMKSTDNGDSWEKTVIWEHPYPFFDWEATVADTFYCVDNSASIALDNNGMAHVTFGINRVMHLELGTTYNYYPFVDGIGYWNEDMDTFSNNLHALAPYTDDTESELIEDVSLIGWTQDVNGNGEIDFITWEVEDWQSYRELGVSTMPSIGIDRGGRVFIAFASATEGFDNGVTNYKHIWTRVKSEGIWEDFQDLTISPTHMFDECIYPIVGQNIDEIPYIMYQADFIPGTALDEDQEYDNNRIIVANYDLSVGIIDNESTTTNFSVAQNTPNPAVNNTKIMVETEESGVINLTVSNILGQAIYTESVDNNGYTHIFNVNVSNLDSGIYFYTIEIGNTSITKKMLVK